MDTQAAFGWDTGTLADPPGTLKAPELFACATQRVPMSSFLPFLPFFPSSFFSLSLLLQASFFFFFPFACTFPCIHVSTVMHRCRVDSESGTVWSDLFLHIKKNFLISLGVVQRAAAEVLDGWRSHRKLYTGKPSISDHNKR